MARPLACALALAFWIGTALGAAPGAAWIGGLVLIALAVAAVRPGPLDLGWRPGPPLVLAAAAAGALAGSAEARWDAATPPAPPATPLWGRVEAVDLSGARITLRIAPDLHPAHRVHLDIEHRPPGLAPGARVRAVGRLRPLYPADEPGGWDARAHGRADHVAWRGRGAVDLLAPASTLAELPLRAREAARGHLDRSARPYGAAVLGGLLLGDRASVPAGALAALQSTGTGHLLAVSGLHVGGLAAVVAALALAVARRFGALDPARWAALAAAPAALGFVTLAQFPLSACRAGLMVGLYLAGRALGRRPDAVVLLAWAAVVLLATRPSAGTSAGFQLSFGAVGALLIFGGRRGLRGAAITAVVAAAATAPIEAWHFGTIAPAAPLANLVLCPLAALVLVPLGLAGLLLAPLTGLPLDLAAAGAEALVAVAEAIAEGCPAWIVGRHGAPAVAAFGVLLAALRGGRWALGGVGAAGLLAASVALAPRGATVDFLPVGQGDAVLVRSAGRAMLVDAGPDPDGFRLLGALRRAGVRRLDAAFVTHGHPDHFAGLDALAGALPIAAVWTNGRPGGLSWRRTAGRLRRHGVPLRVARPGRFSLGALRVDVLTVGGEGPNENDASITLRVSAPGGGSALLTGDIEAAGEARLLAGDPAPVSVLKAPHHGSRTSSGRALLARLCPTAAVFTVGRDNQHRLPHPAVLARYRRAGIARYRTDVDGRITVRLDRPAIGAHRRPTMTLPPAGCGLARLARTRGGGR